MANPREMREHDELTLVGPLGVRAADSAGRRVPEEESDVRTCFQRDVDRITHCKAFRRLKHKTQVFLQPEGDHYRTRLTHTLEVARIARTISRALRLNEDLTEAIALGHDLGHTPFGHAGERALNDIYPGGFREDRSCPAGGDGGAYRGKYPPDRRDVKPFQQDAEPGGRGDHAGDHPGIYGLTTVFIM